jgi:2-succinyl-5-enolpyruvyl-6-hydroxy-3-cyclohexene-1-carboxylate synthase
LLEDNELARQIRRVIVFGKPTLGRAVIRLLFNTDVEVVIVKSRVMGHFDVSRRAKHIVDEISVDAEVDFEWLESWRRANLENQPIPNGQLDRRALVEAVWRATTATDNLFLGASRLIREADAWAPAKAVRVFSNRGLAGIDGSIATAAGIALVEREGTTRALVGDLTLLHDAGSLAIDPLDGNLNLQLVVGNDNGGTIFSGLEMASTLDAPSFDRLFRTPQNVDLWHLAQSYGWEYFRVESLGELDEGLAKAGRVLIDVRLEN